MFSFKIESITRDPTKIQHSDLDLDEVTLTDIVLKLNRKS